MIAGLPFASWLLIVVAVGAGLVIELAFLRAQRRAVARALDARPVSHTPSGSTAPDEEHTS